MLKRFCIFIVYLFGLPLLAAPLDVPAEEPAPQPPLRFEDLSLEEQLGQTLTIFVDIDNAEQFRSVIEKGQVGAVLIQWGNYSLLQTRHLVRKLQGWAAKSPHHLPLLVAVDYEGGTVYTPITLGFDYLPTNMMLSATGDENLAASLAFLAGTELKRTGVHINFSPVLDVNNNPSNPIIGVRSFGSDPKNVARMGLALMDGFQAAGIISIVKHFPGHGDTSVDSHQQLPTVNASKEQLQKIHLAPFASAIQHGVSGIMTSHIIYPALDDKNIATFSPAILQNLLRKQMGFKGLIVTDSLDMKAATSFCSIANCALRSLAAGSDLILLGHYTKIEKTFSSIYAKLRSSPQLQKRVSESARRIFDLKQQIISGKFQPSDEEPIDQAYQQIVKQISQQAVTLVRDRNQLLPVDTASFAQGEKPTVCALFFAPTRFADQLVSFAKPFLEQGWTVRNYNAFLTPKERDIERARECAEGADLLVVTSLQWADKTNKNQKNIIQSLLKENPRHVFISTMSPYDIPTYPQANTVLATYGLNKHILQTAADIILGKQQAQGHLPVTLPTNKTTAKP